ncbi:non-structural maintenance of chromosomes element 1 homolog isoform X1 [Vigna unguiculata]|uniref:non-structural maintenance of chromosomes element 1 homolog isoform X1 n=1 Tax=Vigna unguiculata TaxID=3917 RepID=UPI001015D78A|nr:non-structural maintenance of chromosomes element 1 homolog isoform X1 [Vigna unguiculata]XP_027913556.1 non-structural maintenance of chromosomes element 1 homolog isoform X1 [Vigna unguiculata]XP_027913557.1 non-structural maintenance of chromosomes element 1 homolog isoform X1 [Vigna unguiculata]
MSSALSWRHHVVIQSLFSRGPLCEKDMHAMFEQLTKRNPGTERQLFDGFILKINKALSCANFELRACINQYDGQVYYGVVNTVADEHSKLGTKYSVPQIAFYKAIIEAIVQDASAKGVIFSIHALNLSLDGQGDYILVPNHVLMENKILCTKICPFHCDGDALGYFLGQLLRISKCKCFYSSIYCKFKIKCTIFMVYVQVTIMTDPQSQGSLSNVPSTLKNFSLSQKEKTLNELVQDQWLNLTTEGVIKLGLKSFLDLRSWFRNNDVPSCHVCNEAGIKAEVCQNENCTVRIHQYCLKQLFLQGKVAKVCPSCGTSWPYTVPKEEALQTGDDSEPRQSQRVTRSDRKRQSANRVVVDDGVGCSNQDELNENKEIQNGNVLGRKRRRGRQTDDAETGGPGASQSSAAISGLRRVTRNSARLK